MKRLMPWSVVALLAILPAAGGRASAQTRGYMPSLQEQLDAMRKTIQSQQQELNALKTKVGVSQGDADALEAQRRMIAGMIREETALITQNWGWVNSWKLKGDFRYRHEWLNDGTADANNVTDQFDRNRHRVRVRLGFFAKVNDEFDAGLQLATGSDGDPVSTNQTLGDNGSRWFQKKNVWWDLMYFDYHPKAVAGLHGFGGRMPNPFYRAGGSDLIWDGDLRFDGLAATYETNLGENVTLYVNGGGFWLEERGRAAAFVGGPFTHQDSTLWGAQAAGRFDLPEVAEKLYVTTGVSYYDYANVEGFNPLAAGGNQTVGAGAAMRYVSDFNVINPFVEIGFPVAGLPLVLLADFAVNPSADDLAGFSDNNDLAWMVGCVLGKCKDPGSWEAGYNYRQLQPDSLLGLFSDSDFAGGGTGGRGHKVWVGYQIAKNVKAKATYFCNDRNSFRNDGTDESFYHRVQVDLELKF